ncbi:MAG: hypothetical protein QNJ41_07550 [Xenococcaceae cyanobacterium MO_188.B32]|nr:hypothetical protein [Xenococcaceae cyanobacterium MO_188.B32]
MALPSCSLWILVARTDIPFMMQTIPHLIRMSNYPFQEKVLAVDTAPLSGDKVNRPGVGTLEELKALTRKLLDEGIVDRVVDIDYNLDYQKRVYQKHFGFPLRQTHNYKGYPILGTIFTIEEAQSEYMLHFDSDMLLYQQSDYSWIQKAIQLMEQHPEIISLRPLTGPPTQDGTMYQQKSYQYDPAGFYKFKFFGSRVYLINKLTFNKLLPLPIIWRPYRQKIIAELPLKIQTLLNYTFHKGKLDSWEIMVSKQLESSEYFRGVLASTKAWTLHPKDRSSKFIKALPEIINRIETADYPPDQAGHYDLISELWF